MTEPVSCTCPPFDEDGHRPGPAVALPPPRRPLDTDTDAVAVAALRAGDPAAFDVLFERHAATLHRLARRHVPTAAQAEDVVQQTWLAVLEGIDRFEGRSTFRTWLCTILTYTAQRHAGRDGRVLPFSDAFPDPWGGAGGGAAEALDEIVARHHPLMIGSPGFEVEPIEVVLAEEAMVVLRHAIDALPPRQRAVLVLVDVEGRPPDEACECLGLSHGNLRLLLHRARLRVRRSWRAHLDTTAPPARRSPPAHVARDRSLPRP